MSKTKMVFRSHCRHFTGIMNESCNVGVVYSTIKDTSERPFRYPCLDSECSSLCALVSYFTEEEEKQREAETIEIMGKICLARDSILEVTQGACSTKGDITCPCCQEGRLIYTVASNGHIWASCSTENCVRWVE
jgi:diaminopimelate decarboxylase